MNHNLALFWLVVGPARLLVWILLGKKNVDRNHTDGLSASQKYLIRYGKLAKWMFINAYYKQHLAPCRTGHPALCLNVLWSFSRWNLHVSFSLTSFSFAIWMVAEEKVPGKDWNNTKKRKKKNAQWTNVTGLTKAFQEKWKENGDIGRSAFWIRLQAKLFSLWEAKFLFKFFFSLFFVESHAETLILIKIHCFRLPQEGSCDGNWVNSTRSLLNLGKSMALFR